jgi:hypothetical protein
VRKTIVLALVIVTTSFAPSPEIFAQTSAPSQLGAISGELLDAGGRALAGQRVELVQAGDVIQTTITGSRGEWAFANVPPGDYIVRVVINDDQVSGIPVLVTPGQMVTNVLIVAPSAALESASFLAGPVFRTALVGGIAAAVITTIVVVTGS